MLRKIFIGGVMLVTVLSMSIVVAPTAKAAASTGDLIKANGLSSVYYLGANGKRYVFPNEATYFSWFKDFSSVVTIPAAEMQSYPLAANVLIRPGTKLVKSPSIATVYAVSTGGVLQAIPSEAGAISIYGANWAKTVVDVPDSFFVNYTVGAPLAVGQYPKGQLVKTSGSANVLLLASDGTARSFASEAAFTANNYNFNYVATVPSTFVMPTAGTAVSGLEETLDDVSQGGTAVGPVAGGSGVTAALASDTPAASSVAMNSSVPFVKFNLTAANDGAATVNGITLTAGGLGAVNQIQNVVLYANGTRIGNVKTSADSNHQVIFNLASPLVIPAGTTVSVVAKATVADTNQHSLGIAQAADISVQGATVSGSFPITGNIMSGVNVAVGTLTLKQNGNPADVNLGDTNAIIGEFKMQNSNVEDITLSSITVQRADGNSVNADFANVTLFNANTGVAISEATTFTGASNGYATFVLTTPLVIKENQTAAFEVHADIVGGRANDETVVSVNSQADITAIGNTYGQAATITDGSPSFEALTYSAGTNGFVIKAGAIALGKSDPTKTQVKSNTQNVVFGKLKVTSNSASGASLDTLKITITSTGDNNTSAEAAFNSLANIKLVDEASGQGFDLAYASGVASKVYGVANDIGKTLTTGQTYTFDLEGDIQSNATSSSYAFGIANAITDAIVHDVNNTAISDITPNSLSYASVAVTPSVLTFSVNPLSAGFKAVVGSTGVTALSFNTQANQVDALKITDLKVKGVTTANSNVLNSHVVSQYQLYQTGVATPIKSVSGSNISSGIVDFNGLSLAIASNATNQYYVTEDLVNDSNLTGYVKLGLYGYTAVDSQNNNVYDTTNDSALGSGSPNNVASDGILNNVATVVTLNSARDVDFVGAGSLYVQMDNTNSNTNKSTIQVYGKAASKLAAITLQASNEAVLIKNLTVGVEASGTPANMFSSLTLTDSTGAPLMTVNNVTASTTFTGINLNVPIGSMTVYLTGTLNSYGQVSVAQKNANAKFNITTLGSQNVQGASSNAYLTEATTTINGVCAAQKVCYAHAVKRNALSTDDSMTIYGVASKISSVALVASASGCSSVGTSLSSGNNTVAIIAITTDSNTNTTANNSTLKTVLNNINVNYSTNAHVAGMTIQKCGGNAASALAATATTSNIGAFTFTSSALATAGDNLILPSTTVYYQVVANLSSVVGSANSNGASYFEADLNSLDLGTANANILWDDSSDNVVSISQLLLSVGSQITGTKIVAP
jgi:hypothetical protein